MNEDDTPEDTEASETEMQSKGAANDSSADSSDTALVVFYRTPLYMLPQLAVLLFLTGAAVYLTLKFPQTVQYIQLFQIGERQVFLPIPFSGIFPFFLLTYIIHQLYDSRYVIGPDYVRMINGLLSLKKEDMRIELYDIRGLEIDRGIYGRMLNLGSLHVGSAMGSDIEITLKWIKNPSHYRDIINQRRQKMRTDYQTLDDRENE